MLPVYVLNLPIIQENVSDSKSFSSMTPVDDMKPINVLRHLIDHKRPQKRTDMISVSCMTQECVDLLRQALATLNHTNIDGARPSGRWG